MLHSDDQIVKDYLKYLQSSKKESTIKTYELYMRLLCTYLHSINKNLNSCTATDILDYLHTKTEWTNTTKRHNFTILKSFFKNYFMTKTPVGSSPEELKHKMQRDMELIDIANCPLPPIEHRKYDKAFSIKEVSKLLLSSKQRRELDFLIIWTFLYFGYRKGEFLKISPTKHIIWDENRLNLSSDITKTRHERDLYFNSFTRKILIKILKLKGNKDRLAVYNMQDLNKMFMRYDAALKKHIFPHMCRHTFNTQMLQSLKGKINIDEKLVVRSLMGHNEPGIDKMTEVYTSLSDFPKIAMLKYHYLNSFLADNSKVE